MQVINFSVENPTLHAEEALEARNLARMGGFGSFSCIELLQLHVQQSLIYGI
jgi:hypothetical protein